MSEFFIREKMEKGTSFATAGKACKSLSFISNGYMRIFNYSDGKEVTQYISSAGEFVTDLSSLVFNTPARWNIEALTDCELYSISRADYQRIGQLVPEWPHLEKLFLAKCFLFLEDRVYSFLSMSAEERYDHLFEHKQELFNHVPLQFISSMLGMTPETMSRIRRRSLS